MPDEVARADAGWLALREPADAAARSKDLVEAIRPHLPTDGLVIHDLGCGTGSMARWLAPQLPGPQHWIGYERDEELLARASGAPPPLSLEGHQVTTETRLRDITRLPDEDLDDASLVTASALLDMMTREEIECMVASIAAAGCPALITLSVIGQVQLTPAHPLDRAIERAFNAHQRRDTGHGRLLGPDAFTATADGLARAGYEVHVAPSPWRLGVDDDRLVKAWLDGWVGVASEQEPTLSSEVPDYRADRLDRVQHGELAVMVHHRDLLVQPGAHGQQPCGAM